MVLDLFSRYVVAWMVATRETATRAQRLITSACLKQGIAPGQLTLHQDRGAPMTAKTFSQLLVDLDILQTENYALNLFVQLEETQVRRDCRARRAAEPSQLGLGVGLAGLQQLAVTQGLFEGISVSGHLQEARFPPFFADSDVG